MIDEVAIFQSLPASVRKSLGASEETYDQIRSYAEEGVALLSDIDASQEFKEALASMYARAQVITAAGYQELGSSIMSNFLRIKEKYEKKEEYIPETIIESVEQQITDEEIEKW